MENCVAPGLDKFDLLLEAVLSLVRVITSVISAMKVNQFTARLIARNQLFRML